VVFAWIVFQSRYRRHQVNAKVMADPRIKEICDSANPPLRRLWISLGPGLLFAESKNHKDFQLELDI